MDTRAPGAGTLSHINYTPVLLELSFHTFLHLRFRRRDAASSSFLLVAPRSGAILRPDPPGRDRSPARPVDSPSLYHLHFVAPAFLSPSARVRLRAIILPSFCIRRLPYSFLAPPLLFDRSYLTLPPTKGGLFPGAHLSRPISISSRLPLRRSPAAGLFLLLHAALPPSSSPDPPVAMFFVPVLFAAGFTCRGDCGVAVSPGDCWDK